VRQRLSDPELSFLLLSERNLILAYGFLDTSEVMAELATQMREVKRPFRVGIPDHPGIEL